MLTVMAAFGNIFVVAILCGLAVGTLFDVFLVIITVYIKASLRFHLKLLKNPVNSKLMKNPISFSFIFFYLDARFSKEIRQNGLEAASPTLYNDTIDDIDELRAITVRPFRGRFNNTNSRAPCTCLNNYNCGCCAGMGFGSFRRQRKCYR